MVAENMQNRIDRATEPLYARIEELTAANQVLIERVAVLEVVEQPPADIVPPAVEEEIAALGDGEENEGEELPDGSEEIIEQIEEIHEEIEEAIADVRPERPHWLQRRFFTRGE